MGCSTRTSPPPFSFASFARHLDGTSRIVAPKGERQLPSPVDIVATMLERAVIVYGICIGSEEKYSTFCGQAIPAAFVDNSNIIESRQNDSIFTAYNAVLDQVAARPNVEALVLLHEDLELVPSDFEDQIRRHFQDPDVAIIGAIGGRGVQGVRWSQAHERFGRMPDSFNGANEFGGGTDEVDIVDGCLLVLSPWAVANLRFDSRRFKGFHAYDQTSACRLAPRARR